LKNWINKYLSPQDLEAIKAEIAEVEKKTSSEIRLSLRDKRNLYEKLYKPRELAVRDFEKLGMTNTKYKSGILIFIIFGERSYDILADEGIYEKIHDSVWNELETKLKEEFRNENYVSGIIHLIQQMGSILAKEFPSGPGNIDELKDEVVIN
jgi:uncharacterized membrane protein